MFMVMVNICIQPGSHMQGKQPGKVKAGMHGLQSGAGGVPVHGEPLRITKELSMDVGLGSTLKAPSLAADVCSLSVLS